MISPAPSPRAATSPTATPVELTQAAVLLAAMDHGRDADAAVVAGVRDVAAGLAFQDQINRLRIARGEHPVGFKIGFTNRTIWDRYGVHAPIWAPVWDTTVVDLTGEQAGPGAVTGQRPAPMASGEAAPPFDAGAIALRLNRPRLEPEVVFGLRSVPAAGDPAAAADAIEWVAHGFEIVQSPWPDWQFHAGQAIASQSLHGALLIGPRRRVRRPPSLAAALSAMEVELCCNGRPVAHGHGRDVLDGPLQALIHWLDATRTVVSASTVRPAAGMLVTTGPLTDAQPIVAGARWQSKLLDPGDALQQCLDGPLMGLDVVFGRAPSIGR